MGWVSEKMAALRRRSPRRFLAVDFDSSQLRIVRAERTGRGARIVQLIGVDMPKELDVADAPAVGAFLGQTLKEMGLREKGVLMNVPRGQAVLRPVTLPPGTGDSEVAGMVRFQVEGQLPFAAAEAVVDFAVQSHYDIEEPPQTSPPGVDVLAAAVRLPVLDHYRQIALSAGLRPLRLGLRPYATARCVQSCLSDAERRQCFAVVHVTADEAEIDVCEGPALTFSRSIVGKIPSSPAHPDKAAETAAGTVVAEVVRSLQSYRYRGPQRGADIARVLVVGGTGIEPRVARLLGRRLGIECQMLDPGPALGLEGVARDTSSSFTSALGLAGGYDRPGELPFDFLNPKRPPVQRDVRKIRAAAIAAGAVLLVALSALAGAVHLSGKQHAVTSLIKDCNELKQYIREHGNLRKHAQDVAAWLDARCNWLDHLANLSRLFPPKTDAFIDAVGTGSDARSIEFVMNARSRQIVADFEARTRAAGYQTTVDQVLTKRDPRYGFSARVELVPNDPSFQMPTAGAASRPSAKEAAP